MKRRILGQFWLEQLFQDNIINQVGGKKEWATLSHNGLLFPPEYVQHYTPLVYDGKDIVLDSAAEEIATIYAKYLESEYINNKIFTKNFWKDFKHYIKKYSEIKDFSKCDFSKIKDYVLKEKERKMLMTKDEKLAIKEEKDKEAENYKVAILDGKAEPVGNFRVEPPGIFIGRGCHPKLGKIKPRVFPSDITINIGKESKIPSAFVYNKEYKWKKVIHNKEVKWLASWSDIITGKIKYVWLGSHSKFKAESDLKKFELARKLKSKIKNIRAENDNKILNGTLKEKQTATALYFIDNLALRVGNEKGADEADTVGTTSLRVEHIKIGSNNEITLDFLGKDSVRYVKKITVSDGVYKNIVEFSSNKSPSANLFDLATSADLNKYLQNFMKNLTAKVFRTYNASYLFQKELNKAKGKFDNLEGINKVNLLLDEYNKANAKVALLCNHQKKVTSSFNEQISKINDRLKVLKQKYKSEENKEKKSKLNKKILELKSRKVVKIELKGVSLGTSKINYIDPRITIAFIKKNNIPVDKIFTKSLQEKFNWAFDVTEDYKF